MPNQPNQIMNTHRRMDLPKIHGLSDVRNPGFVFVHNIAKPILGNKGVRTDNPTGIIVGIGSSAQFCISSIARFCSPPVFIVYKSVS